MIRFPFYGFPRNPFLPGFSGYNYNNNPNKTNTNLNKNLEEENSITNSTEFSNTIPSPNYNFYSNSSSFENDEQAIFEFFGIKLFVDDLIILGLLFFLYREQSDDQILYIILLLLLFS